MDVHQAYEADKTQESFVNQNPFKRRRSNIHIQNSRKLSLIIREVSLKSIGSISVKETIQIPFYYSTTYK